MKKWYLVWLVGLVCMLAVGQRVSAAEFSPVLDDQLSRAGAKEMVGALVILPNAIDIQVLDDQLHMRQASKLERKVQVLQALRYNADQTQPKITAEFDEAIANGEMEGYTAYWIENLICVSATKGFIESLRSRGDIRYCSEKIQPELIEPIRTPAKSGGTPPVTSLTLPPGIQAIGAYRVNTELGITGQGVLVANMDTGVDGTHPALQTRWRGYNGAHPWQECWKDILNSSTTPVANGAHGTHVMGTITGRAIVGADTQWIGCAPDAQWIADKCIDQGVPIIPNMRDAVLEGFQWFADPDGNPGTLDDDPDVVQNSWGVTSGHVGVQCYDYWNTVITNCEASGTVITWSAGNEGTAGLRSPAIYELTPTEVFAVGAVDATNYPNEPYPLAGFSSQGPSPCPPTPGSIKPEIAAPGVNVYSSVPGGYDGTYSGTSMAGPHVAGCVALMRQACPNCDPTTIKMAIMNTAHDYGTPGEDNQYGAGFIDCYQAVLAVSNLGHLVGVVRDAANNPLAGATVHNVNGLQTATTNASGQYDLALSSGTYNIQYSKFGYVTQQVNGLVVTEGQNTTQDVNLNTAPIGTVSGTVTSCAGGPAVGATVTILGTPISPATTNGSGFYSIANVPQGTYDMQASGAGCGVTTVAGVVIGASTIQNFTLAPDPHFLCSAPDAQGYSACENGDLGGPTFSWTEISPNAGGPGTNTNITGDDNYGTVALPFTFRLYGQNYTSAYPCTNGFITFDTQQNFWGNACLPYGSYGHAILPFWDDLYVDAGQDISKYYLAAENAMIIEWHNVRFYSGGGNVTMQVWLYNVSTNPTPWGDSQIKIVYQSISGTLSSSTVGIQNGSIFNQYTCNGANDPNAQGLVTGNRVIAYGMAVAPTAPTGLTVQYLTSTNELRFDWTASAGATGYTLYSSTVPGGPFTTVVGTSATNSLTIPFPGTGLLFYEVTAHN